MEIEIINQVPDTINSLLPKFRKEFRNKDLKDFKCLMAYTTWDGIDLLHEEMEMFYDRSGTCYSMILGIGVDGREIDVLRYFKDRLPRAEIFLFNASNIRYIFHPKVYVFTGSNLTTVFIGSNNFSLGGFSQNSECLIKLGLDNNNDRLIIRQINNIWNSYRYPKPPFSSLNSRRLTNSLILKFERYKIKPAKQERKLVRSRTIKDLFPSISIPLVASNINKNYKSDSKQRILDRGSPAKSGPSRTKLLMQVMSKETGAGGTQIQIPKEVLTRYFRVNDFTKNKTIQLRFDNEYRPAVICIFNGNHTYRISIPEIRGFSRPLILRFIHSERNKFEVQIITGGRYSSELKKCINQTTNSSKKWVII